MGKYVLRRLAGAVPLVLGIATIIFFLVNLAPGDPTLLLISPGVTTDVIEQMRANFGLDQPIHIRYVRWLGAMLTGDFGYSFVYSRPVVDLLMDALPNTLHRALRRPALEKVETTSRLLQQRTAQSLVQVAGLR